MIKSSVVGFEHGYTQSALRMKYALACLDCGHRTSIQFRPYKGACLKCGIEIELEPAGSTTTCPVCTCQSFSITFSPDAHTESNYITQRGDKVTCPECVSNARAVAALEVLDPTTVHHARFRHGGYCLYKLDHTSPSNFMLLLTVPAIPAIDTLLQAKGICALSPTEPA